MAWTSRWKRFGIRSCSKLSTGRSTHLKSRSERWTRKYKEELRGGPAGSQASCSPNMASFTTWSTITFLGTSWNPSPASLATLICLQLTSSSSCEANSGLSKRCTKATFHAANSPTSARRELILISTRRLYKSSSTFSSGWPYSAKAPISSTSSSTSPSAS